MRVNGRICGWTFLIVLVAQGASLQAMRSMGQLRLGDGASVIVAAAVAALVAALCAPLTG